ncbi:hypothetical protein ISN45_Aa04g009380 [Arabidopsis thaliana x Arabidopsis arenosa]|uniref:Uncharacterized protein n=1 Tax=Arabidopsis thaliana x Arabidopsis arenosa TaxID=1240361 RepID=A0A8T2A679_9BRAS|nr:hypothetical protein ISN45_Aa04g009380 [Arabidopsis thaliana x Arabidopsis arenosa]
MKNRLDYMRSLWQCDKILTGRTGISTNSITAKIDMPDIWWIERIQEFGKNGKYVRVLQNKPMPFKEILGQIYGKHDVEQDDRYSPHTLRAHLEQSLNDRPSDDDIEVHEASDDNGSQFSLELTSDEDLQRAGPSPIPTTNEQARSSPSHTYRSNLGVRKTTTRRLLDVLRSRHNQKATFGDALAEQEILAVEPMGKFWWEANRLLMNDEDVRDGFMKLRSEENKIQFLERLVGVDRYGLPCDNISLRSSSSSVTPYVPATHSQMAGIKTNASTSLYPGYGVSEMGSSGTSFSSLIGLSPQTH